MGLDLAGAHDLDPELRQLQKEGLSSKRSANLKQGWRGWVTCSVAVPMRTTSPMCTVSSSMPSMVRFSPSPPGTHSAPCSGNSKRYTA
jgi:hypothetical protein